MSSMKELFLSGIYNGLQRQTMNTVSRWASKCIVMGKPFPGPLNYRYHPWIKDMQDSMSRYNIGQKAAQMGYTTACLNWALYSIDVLRENVLYLLPSKTPDATDFSANRFDPMLESSPHLRELFSSVKNVGSKRAGTATLYIRGANSRKGLKSVPAGRIVMDEFDEFNEAMVPLADERSSGQEDKQSWLISTPRFPGLGINQRFLQSTQEHFFFRCPSCSQHIELLHENLVIIGEDLFDPRVKESYIQCCLCKAHLTQPQAPEEDNLRFKERYKETKAEQLLTAFWQVMGIPNPDYRGFYINQLYSPTIYPFEMAEAHIKAQTNKSAEQEYHNSKMGDAHEVEGARISDDDIIQCQMIGGGRRKVTQSPPGYLITMGVDVGTWLHFWIDQWIIKRMGNDLNVMSEPICLAEDKILCTAGFTGLDLLMREFQIHQAVVDIGPERASAAAFAKRFWGHVKLCEYSKGLGGKSLQIDAKEDDFKIRVDRTMWLDISLSRFKSRTIMLPQDLSLEAKGHFKNIARIYEEDKDGNQVGRYVSNGADHTAHARNYSEIALPLAASAASGNRDVRSFL